MTLEEIIRAEIAARGPMRFDRFMEFALYHPGLGYYAKTEGPVNIGRHGDFITSVSVGPLFGHLLARQFLQMWERLEKADPFWIIEQGGHDGRLERDVLDWSRAEAPEFHAAIRYAQVTRDSTSLAAKKPIGVFFSNELVDAFPVCAIVHRGGIWRERCVQAEGEKFTWTESPIYDDELARTIAELRLPEKEGFTTEINLRARTWMRDVARTLHRGYVLTMDYGYPAFIYYAPFRSSGTLTAYAKHQRSGDVLADPGRQDITAHVDFTALASTGEAAGLATLGFLDQQHFFMGIAQDELSGGAIYKTGIAENVRAWNMLTHPTHLGAKFFALIQAKDAPTNLDGLRYARPGGLHRDSLAAEQ